MMVLSTLLLGSAVFAQSDKAQPIQSPRDALRSQYTPNDYQNFLQRERNGEVLQQSGPVFTKAVKDAVISNNPDVLVNNNIGFSTTSRFTQSETAILAFGNTVVAGFNDSGSNAGGANKFTGWSYSTDGGATFTDGGTLPTNAGGDAGDPVLARNESTGRIYYATLGFSVSTIQIFRSDDNGVTWSAPVNGSPGGSSEDKEWLTVDNYPGAGNGNVYLISRRFGSPAGIYVFRSTDNGATFGPVGGTLITSGAQGAFVAIGPDHAVYAFWWGGSTILMRKSTNFGSSFGPTVTVATGLVGGTNGDLALTGIRQGTVTAAGFRSNSFPHAAINPVSGHIYVTFNDNPAGSDKADVYLVMSTDGGATWSARTRVNDDATITDQWQPTIAVTPDGVTVGVFYSSRQEDAANNLFKYYGRTALISGSTLSWSPSFAISDVASLPEFGRDSVVNSTYMGDYNMACATPGFFHVLWSDNRDDLPGGAPRKDPNVYYEKILAGLLTGPNIAVIPTSLNFGSVAVTSTANSSVIIQNIGDAPLTVSAITSPAPDFTLGIPALPVTIPSLGTISLPASFAPATLGPQTSGYTITSDALNTPVVNATMSGTGVTNIAVSPLSISYGDVAVGTTAGPTPVTITNRGGVNLTVSSISAPGNDFSVSYPPTPIVLAPAGTATVNVSFAPTSAGLHNATFDIASDAVGTPTVTVSLDGNGIIPPPNDLCANAIPVACGTSVNGTTVLASFDNVGTCGTSNTAPGVWYTVTGTGAPITVATCLAHSYDTKISVFSGSCGALVCVGGNDDFCAGLASQVTFNSVAGTTYLVLVHGFLSAVGTFTLSVSPCPAEIAVSPDSLVILAPLNSVASGQLAVSNPADPGALDLVWSARSSGLSAIGDVGDPSLDGVNREPMFQVTQQTIDALAEAEVPGPILMQLLALIGTPPMNKDDFRAAVVALIGEARVNEVHQPLFESSLVWVEEKEPVTPGSIATLASTASLPDDGITLAGGPDAFGYSFIDSDSPGGPTFSWMDITGTGTAVVLTDDSSVLVPLPFVFPFYGVNQTQVRIGSNGYLTFGTSGSTFTNTDIPNTSTPNNIICPFWDDLNPATGGTVHYLSSPTQFIVQYTNIKHFGTTSGPYTFEVILNADGSMLYQYLSMQGSLTSATVGIENSTGTVGLKAVFNAAYVHNNLAVSFFLPPPCTWITSLVPTGGTVPAGNSQQVTVNASSAGLGIGVYYCQITINSNAVNAPRLVVPATLIVGTPLERLDACIQEVLALQAAGALNGGQATSLIAKLQAAKASIQRGMPNTSINQLNAYINEVNAYVETGILTAQQGQDLIDCVEFVIHLLEQGYVPTKRGGGGIQAVPATYGLEQNSPNPFNPTTEIRFALPEAGNVILSVYNVTGRLVKTLVSGQLNAGYHSIQWDGTDGSGAKVASGLYMYRIQAGTFAETRKMIMMK